MELENGRYQREADRLHKKTARTSELLGKLQTDPEYLVSSQCQFCSFQGPEEEVERHESACFAKAKRHQAALNFSCRYCDFDAQQKHEVVIHEANCEAREKGTMIRTKDMAVRKPEEKDQEWRENLKVKVKCHSCPQVMTKFVLKKH